MFDSTRQRHFIKLDNETVLRYVACVYQTYRAILLV